LTALVEARLGRAVQSLGRNSLSIFAAGSLISAVGQAALGAASRHTSEGIEHLAGLAYTVAGIAALFVIARWIECKDKPAPPPRRAFHSAAPQPL
jgi:hypothetical protein